jgi:hypothetical protein
MQAILLLLLLALGVYYRVRISPLHRLILIGCCVYSSVQVANDQFLLINKIPVDSIFGDIRRGSFLVPVAIWTYAVWRHAKDSAPQPDRISQSTYDELSPPIHDRLRDLNGTLDKLRKR